MAWSETEDDEDAAVPVVFDTKEAAWKEIAEGIVTELQQFIDGEREYEDTSWATDEYVANYQQFEDGSIVVHDEEGNPIIETTLDKWRAAR